MYLLCPHDAEPGCVRVNLGLHDPAGVVRSTGDLLAFGGVSKVGDWPGANADQPPVTP